MLFFFTRIQDTNQAINYSKVVGLRQISRHEERCKQRIGFTFISFALRSRAFLCLEFVIQFVSRIYG